MTAAFLLDVNILFSLLWPDSTDHDVSQAWFRRHGMQGWATCPFTQAAFVRLSSNPSVSRRSLTPTAATSLLAKNLLHPAHEFWPSLLSFEEAAAVFSGNLKGHQQVTDAYLLALAIHKKARLVTRDKGLQALLPEGSPLRKSLVLI